MIEILLVILLAISLGAMIYEKILWNRKNDELKQQINDLKQELNRRIRYDKRIYS